MQTDPALLRALALPLTPIVAAVDLTTAIFKAWAEWGTRQLNRLDPLFARFTRLMIRVGNWAAPATERISASIERFAARLVPIIVAAGRLATRAGAHVRRTTRPLVNGFIAVRGAARRAIRPIGTAVKRLTSPLVAAVSWTTSRVRSTISSLRRSARPRLSQLGNLEPQRHVPDVDQVRSVRWSRRTLLRRQLRNRVECGPMLGGGAGGCASCVGGVASGSGSSRECGSHR
ncbi:MAG: hypothetical protein FD127_2503 [Acidimicrobiaceae bacterium]|nr:MAG: hypothetical protein FD127_2503 [Acidimicrobiaceae bacterium]